MNLLVPDSWLRDFLDTDATPIQIKEYLSLCAVSVDRINYIGKEAIYEIEVTSNRPDDASIMGIAREAAAVLPRFGIKAGFKNDIYTQDNQKNLKKVHSEKFSVKIITDPVLNPRWTSIIIDKVKIKPSPVWMQKRLELTGIRPINNLIDITNYLMRAYGQPVHAFDYKAILPDKNNQRLMILRSSKRGEKITTLDGKTHNLAGDDIVIQDGSGRLIDLCGIMGGLNSSITNNTETVLLFMQTYDPVRIRKTMMHLSHRTEAGTLFEKGTDDRLVLPVMIKGIELVQTLTGGKVAGKLTDIYPQPWSTYEVILSKARLNTYLGKHIADNDIRQILNSLGFSVKVTQQEIIVKVPSFRRDITIDVDIIEEIVRIYGYHNIGSQLPQGEIPQSQTDPQLWWEDEIKIRLRDWGYTETYTYSMISEELMDLFKFDKYHCYQIANPLSTEWVYMRPSLLPSVLTNFAQNMHIKSNLQMFELSKVYDFKSDNLPYERSMLAVTWSGEKFYFAKGLAESLFELLGVNIETLINYKQLKPYPFLSQHYQYFIDSKFLKLGSFGLVGIVDPILLSKLNINQSVTVLLLDFAALVACSKPVKKYHPLPKYPPIIEDLTFVFPPRTRIGDVLYSIKQTSTLINKVDIKDRFNQAVTFTLHYLHPRQSLTSLQLVNLRQQIVKTIQIQFSAQLKGKV